MYELKTKHLFAYEATLAEPEIIGPVAEGIRVNFWVTGGVARGPRIEGTLRPVGGDFMLLRRDGVAELNVRAVIETGDGALIDLAYHGLSDLGEGAYERFLEGQLPDMLRLRTEPRLRSAHPDYADLARSLYIGVGEGDIGALRVRYDVYTVL